jgi:hypothetical protein
VDNVWIIGGGKFGLRAARALAKKHSLTRLTIVEKEKAVCRQLDQLGFEAVCKDAVEYLERNLASETYPDWIVPAIPLHVAFECIKTKLSKSRIVQELPVAKDLLTELPNPITADTGQVYISIADFECPENCSEPDGICTHTGKPRLMVLHEYLKSVQLKNAKTVVIQSHQLAPGVGGYTPRALFAALNKIEAIAGPVSLSTACSCHGILQIFETRFV